MGGCGGPAPVDRMGFEPGVFPTEEPLLTATTATGTRISLWTAPSPPSKGATEVLYRVMDDASSTPVDALALGVVPWMPAHGHGTSVRAVVTPEGDGWYLAKVVYFYMSGRWELRTTLAGSVNDEVVPVLDIP